MINLKIALSERLKCLNISFIYKLVAQDSHKSMPAYLKLTGAKLFIPIPSWRPTAHKEIIYNVSI